MAHIKVPEQTPKISYAVTTPEEDTFNINFVIFESDGSDIDVFDLDVLLSPALYVITPVPGTEGGFIGGTLVLNVPVTDTTIVIVRNIVLERTTDFPTAGPFNINALNTELDRMAGMIQQIREAAAVSFGEAISVVEAANLQIKEPASIRGGKVLGFDANGDLDLQTGVGLWRDNWVTSTFYGLRDVVRDDAAGDDTKNLYICVIEHTSGTWSTDLAANNWDLMVDVESVTISETNAAASEAAASVSETNAGVSETNAATSETNAASSASDASTSATNAGISETNAATSETNAGISETNAANSAATVNLPDISGSNVGDMLVVNAGKTGYDFTVPAIGDLVSTNNLSDVVSAPTSLVNIGGIGSATTNTLTNKTIDANGTGNVLSNIDIANCLAASQAEAEAGSDNTKLLTSLRTAQAIAAQAPGALVRLLSVNIDDNSSIGVTGLGGSFTYMVVISDLEVATDSVAFVVRVGDSSGYDSGASDYTYHTQAVQDGSSAYAALSSSGTSAVQAGDLIGNASGEGYNAVIYISRSSAGGPGAMIYGTYSHVTPSGILRGGIISGRRKDGIDLDRILVFASSGNLLTGRYMLYGII